MVKMRMLISMAGQDFAHNRGDVIDCTEAEANRYEEYGVAEPIGRSGSAAPVERATKRKPAEMAVKET